MRRILLLSALCTFALLLSAQSPWSLAAEIGVGLSGNSEQEQTFGFLNSSISYTDTWQERPVPTFNVGFHINYVLDRQWQLSAGLVFRQVGARADLTRNEFYQESSLKISQARHMRFQQRQLAAQFSARYKLLDGRNLAQPFVLFGAQAVRLFSQRVSWDNNFVGRGPRGRDIFARDENPDQVQLHQANPWGMNLFMGVGVQLKRVSVHLQYDWQAFPQGNLLYADRGVYLPTCYTCQFVERSTQPLLRHTSIRLGYRLF
ncbi:MAG: outer membrane beta-barrel protein [Bacteroidota bacterium]